MTVASGIGAKYEWVLRASGSKSFFSLIAITIFSKSSGVMCLSRPRLRLLFIESCLWIWGREISSGADVEEVSESNSRASSSGNESRLPERSGRSCVYWPSESLLEMEIAGVVALASPFGSQQKVSRVHNLQLKFSNLRPSSNDPEHLEKTVHMLKRFSTFRVSTL